MQGLTHITILNRIADIPVACANGNTNNPVSTTPGTTKEICMDICVTLP